jgi:hypothetical protein
MNNTQVKNDSQNKAKSKESLRGEAPQKHGVKSKKIKKVNPETAAARQALIAMSQEAQDMMEMAENGMELEGFEDCEKVNDFLLVMHQQATGCEHFKTFHDWKKAGYKVKKGSKSYRVWGSPLKAKKPGEEQQAEPAPEAEGKSDAAKTFKFWPMCSLFTENQVEPIEGGEESQEAEKQEPQQAPAQQEDSAAQSVEFVPVAKYRQAIESLERFYNYDRCSCVGDKEKKWWLNEAPSRVAKLEGLSCKRAKAEDHEAKAVIISKVKAYLADNPEPTPPKPGKKSQETKSEAANDAATNYTQDMGNNESLTRGLFPESNGDFVAMTFTESKTFKTRAGAVRWLAARGLDETGRSIEEPKTEEEDTTGEPSPFVTVDYQEQQEARKDRMLERADKASADFQATYNRAKDMASVIPFGQPILVGHHSEKRDRRYRDKIHNTFGKAFELDSKADHYRQKAATVGNTGIASNDPEAIEKLKNKLAGLERSQETMKTVNKIIRASKLTDEEKAAEIVAAGLLSEAQAIEILKPDHCGRIGFASYSLSNNNAEINRTKKRINELERLRNSDPLEFENDDFSMAVDNGRVCIEFAGGKPSDDVRAMLRGSAFKWSRYQGAWVRKATANGVAEAGRLLERLKAVEEIY